MICVLQSKHRAYFERVSNRFGPDFDKMLEEQRGDGKHGDSTFLVALHEMLGVNIRVFSIEHNNTQQLGTLSSRNWCGSFLAQMSMRFVW